MLWQQWDTTNQRSHNQSKAEKGSLGPSSDLGGARTPGVLGTHNIRGAKERQQEWGSAKVPVLSRCMGGSPWGRLQTGKALGSAFFLLVWCSHQGNTMVRLLHEARLSCRSTFNKNWRKVLQLTWPYLLALLESEKECYKELNGADVRSTVRCGRGPACWNSSSGSNPDSSFLLMPTVGGGGEVARCSVCHTWRRAPSAWLQALAWPSPGCWQHLRTSQRSSLFWSFCCSNNNNHSAL